MGIKNRAPSNIISIDKTKHILTHVIKFFSEPTYEILQEAMEEGLRMNG